MSLTRQMTFRTNMRLNAMEYDEIEGADGVYDNGLDFTEFSRLTREREVHDFTEEELRQRFLKLDVTGSGRIEKHEWLRFSLRDSLARSITKVMEIFHAWDDDGSGTIDEKEFRQAVRALGFSDVRDVDIDHIFREFDVDGSGQISQLELERKLKKYAGVMLEQRYALRREAGGRKGAALGTSVKLDRESGVPIAEQLRDVLVANAVRVIDLFRDWDEDGNGLIDTKEFAKGMIALGVTTSKTEAQELFDTFDPDGSGTIEFNELHKALRKQAAAVSQAQRRRERSKQIEKFERWSEDAVRSHALHGHLQPSSTMGYAMSSLGRALMESRSAASLMYGHNIGPGYGYTNHGLVPSGNSRGSYFLSSNRASAASLIDSDISVSASAIGEGEEGASLPLLNGSPSSSSIRHAYGSGGGGARALSSLRGSASQPSLGRAGGPHTQSVDTIQTTGGTSVISNATMLGSRTHTLPRAAMLQAERVIRASEREEGMRRSASSSILMLPTNSHVVRDPARRDGASRPLSMDHLAELWMQPRPGGNPVAMGRMPQKVAPQPPLPFTPSFLPPLAHTQIKPLRAPHFSPSASQKTVDEMYVMHENKLFGSGNHKRAANGAFSDAEHIVPGIIDNRGAARDKPGTGLS